MNERWQCVSFYGMERESKGDVPSSEFIKEALHFGSLEAMKNLLVELCSSWRMDITVRDNRGYVFAIARHEGSSRVRLEFPLLLDGDALATADPGSILTAISDLISRHLEEVKTERYRLSKSRELQIALIHNNWLGARIESDDALRLIFKILEGEKAE